MVLIALFGFLATLSPFEQFFAGAIQWLTNLFQHVVSESSVLLAIIGDRWVDARDEEGKKRLDDRQDFVRVEIELALKKEIPVIPLLVRGAQMPLEEDLPYSLRRLIFQNGLQIRPDPDFHRGMDRLISELHEHM